MNDNRFDKLIKEKLEGYQTPDVGGWNQLRQKISADPILNDSAFDEKVREQMASDNPTVPPADWTLFEQYRQNKYLANQVMAIKAGEFLILLLSFFTIANYSLWPEPADEDVPVALQSTPEDQAVTEESFAINPDSDKAGQSYVNPGITTPGTNSTRTRNSGATSRTHADRTAGQVTTRQLNGHGLNGHGTLLPAVGTATPTAKVMMGNPIMPMIGSLPLLQHKSPSPVSLTTNQSGTVTPLLDRGADIENPGLSNGRWLHVYSSINNYTIKSPADLVYNVGPKTLYAPGYSVTALMSSRMGPAEFTAGISYSRLSYEPYPIRETYRSDEGINIVSLENISYDIITIPVGGRYHLLSDRDWSVYAGLGLQPGLVINEHYQISDKLDVPIPRPESAHGSAEFRSKLSEKEFTRAVFNGGRFSENVFLQGFVQAGIQRQLGPHSMLYLDVAYAQHLATSLGPNNDRIHVFSFGTGVKFRL